MNKDQHDKQQNSETVLKARIHHVTRVDVKLLRFIIGAFFTRLFEWNPIVERLISWVCQTYPFASFTRTFIWDNNEDHHR